MTTNNHEVIFAIVNSGFAEDVMDVAREQGARGGTIIRGRWVDNENFEALSGFAGQEEKEIILIVVPREIRNTVMEAINEKHGLQTEAGALLCATGVDQLVHLG